MTSNITFRSLGTLLFWVVAPLVIGLWLSQSLVPQPAVGIIRLNSDIWAGSAELVRLQVERARRDPTIKAIVFQLNSPGGDVSASQVIYLELEHLRQEMPVVASIDTLAASGGYYAALATYPIYTTPSAIVGNVGVIAVAPFEPTIDEVVFTSGPFKLTATNHEEFLRGIEAVRQEFVGTVFSQRGEYLTISRTDLSQGLAYQGREALNLGLVDRLGSQTEAIAEAARQAGIAHYRTVDLYEVLFMEFNQAQTGLTNEWPSDPNPLSGKGHLTPGLYLLYHTEQENLLPRGIQ